MKTLRIKLISILLALAVLLLPACGVPDTERQSKQDSDTGVEQYSKDGSDLNDGAPDQSLPDRDGIYDSRDEVALYIHTYGELPSNYITKKEAEALGWQGGSLEDYAPGKCIGGNHFGNYEGQLPEGHSYKECDIDTLGKSSRGAKRIVYSDDGLIYYTDDHYSTFTLLYGEE